MPARIIRLIAEVMNTNSIGISETTLVKGGATISIVSGFSGFLVDYATVISSLGVIIGVLIGIFGLCVQIRVAHEKIKAIKEIKENPNIPTQETLEKTDEIL